jgi:pimeloyl-ACP methyl ester carboxylesterase
LARQARITRPPAPQEQLKMNTTSSQKSTSVRSSQVPWTLRAAVSLGSVLAPATTTERALALFCTPMGSSRTRAARSELGGARLKRLQVGREDIATYAWGDVGEQPTVLMSHGWSSFGLRFLPWVAMLRAAGYAVVSFDQPGHGRNGPARITLPGFADTVLAVGEHFGQFAAAIGHSLGGAAIAVAMRDGLKVDRAILIAPAADASAASRRFAAAIALPDHQRSVMQRLLEQRTGRSLESLAVHRVAPHLAQPALVIHDLVDSDVPWEEGERYARFWPDARLLSVQGLGHHKIVNDPAVIDAGRAFLAGELVGERVVSTQELVYGYA